MKVSQSDELCKCRMDELPSGVDTFVKGVAATWKTDHFVLKDSEQVVSYGSYRLKDITVNRVDVRPFHGPNGTCQTLPVEIAAPRKVSV